jgi:basic membrane lipoprotein Med (substrate-binding protein (PBP1-ABC) superfamily)
MWFLGEIYPVRMRRRVAVLLAGTAGDGGFVDGALAAVRDAVAAGADVVVCHEAPEQPDPSWDAVVCHGIQHLDWVRRHHSAYRRAVLTDRPPTTAGLDGVTLVDWCWDQAGYCAGAFAAALAGEAPVGLIAGPPVLTQRRMASAYAAGAMSARTGETLVHHLRSFDDRAGGAAAGGLLAGPGRCAVVAHSADAAGEDGCARARKEGAATVGFLGASPDHAAYVRSDVTGVVAEILRRLDTDEELPAVFDCGLDSGYLDLVLAEDAAPAARRAVERARADVRAGAV